MKQLNLKITKKAVTIFTIFLVSISVHSQSWWGSKKVRGNGNVITKIRAIETFKDVSVGGSFDVILIDGKEGEVKIEGEENIIPYIETEVRHNTLKVKFKENINIKTTKKLKVTIPFEEIEGVSIGGSGDVKVKKIIKTSNISFSVGGSGSISANINTETAKASIGGSGSIKISGKSDNLKCSIAGSGNVKAYELQTGTVKASIAGSGDIYTSVTTKIKASVVGSGSIYYKGNPKYIDINSVGSGDVIDKN